MTGGSGVYDIGKMILADSIQDAIRALVEDPAAVIICGGSDVLIGIREGELAGCSLVSIHNIPDLKGISLELDGTILIRPATSFSSLANSSIIQQYIPMLGHAADEVGGPQIRNMGTIGGNICIGVTSADSAPSLLALNAVLELTGENGTRLVPIREFYTGPGKTVRQHDEILTAILITRENYEGYFGHFIKYGKRNAMEIATIGCAVQVKLSADRKSVEDLRLAYGVAAPTPLRCVLTEDSVKGMAVSAELLDQVGKGALAELNPRTSWRASKAFRLQLIEELGKRALKQAVLDAGGDL
jgi:xanthine dehydrogenase FAD-binding subunit